MSQMTHNQLLDRIEEIEYWQEQYAGKTFLKALRAVVQLHKPNIKGGCDICSWIIGGFVLYEVCPTIQAIEKELM